MSTPETLDDLFLDPQAKIAMPPGLEAHLDAYAEAATHTTIYGLYEVNDPLETIEAHDAGIADASWLADAGAYLTLAEVTAIGGLARKTRTAHRKASPSGLADDRVADEKEAYAVNRAIKQQLGRRTPPPSKIARALMERLWGAHPNFEHIVRTKRSTKSLMPSLWMTDARICIVNKLGYEEAASDMDGYLKTEAEIVSQVDDIVLNGLVPFINKQHEAAQRRAEKYSHGVLMLPWLNAGVAYMLLRHGLPETQLFPYPAAKTEDDFAWLKDDARTAEAESFARAGTYVKTGKVALQQTIPDPITRTVLKKRLGLPVLDSDMAASLLAVRLRNLPYIYHNRGTTTLNNYQMHFAEVAALSQPEDIRDLYERTRTMHEYVATGHFLEYFEQKKTEWQALQATMPSV